MTTDQVIKAIRQAIDYIRSDGSMFAMRQEGYASGMIALAYFQGVITLDDYHTLNAEVESKVKGEKK